MESFTDIINSDKPTLVDFFATWCGPCKAMTPVMDQLKKEVGESARILKIDVDKNQSLAAKFQVRGVPTFVIFKSGKVVWRQSGGMSMQTFINELKKHI
jgi:thioredoxin 1